MFSSATRVTNNDPGHGTNYRKNIKRTGFYLHIPNLGFNGSLIFYPVILMTNN